MPRRRSSAPDQGALFERAQAPNRAQPLLFPAPEEEEHPEIEPAPVAEQAQQPPEPAPEPASTSPPAFFDEPYREFEHNQGVHLTDSVLWCDAKRLRDLCFISHAHFDFVGKNRKILATDKTIRILTRASGKIDALTSPYRRQFTLGPLKLEMHPAGHVLGSAQLLIERNDRRIVYTSDVNTRQTATVERAKPVACDVLAIPATYGLPLYRFPPREEVFERMKTWIERCFEDHATPVLLADTIGASQEVMRLLGDAGLKLRVHGSIYDVAKIYRDLGVSLPGSRRFGGTPARDEVVIFPPILKTSPAIRKLRKSKTAIISGRAVEPGFAFQQRVDDAFPLSDVADHAELLDFVLQTGAKEVFLFDGHVAAFAEELRGKGLKVHALEPPKQLALL